MENLRFLWDGDGKNSFIHRGGLILEKISTEQPDVIAFQEVVDKSADFLERHLPQYNFVYAHRDAEYIGEGLVIAYKRAKFNLFSLDTFWLSDTPQVAGSVLEGQSPCARVCQSALLQEKQTHRVLRVVNVHLDYISQEIAVKQMRLILAHLDEKLFHEKTPFFILGDFNSEPDSETIALCHSSTHPRLCELTESVTHTFHAFGTRQDACKIDYVFADTATAQKAYTVTRWEDEVNGIYLSDHYPLSVELEF